MALFKALQLISTVPTAELDTGNGEGGDRILPQGALCGEQHERPIFGSFV